MQFIKFNINSAKDWLILIVAILIVATTVYALFYPLLQHIFNQFSQTNPMLPQWGVIHS
jgi:hypothetical protein